MAALPDEPQKSYLTQKFAKLGFGPLTVIGYSVAGEETVVQVPELNVCFDAGRAPQFALTSDVLCLSHAHMDHVAGVAYYLSQRYFQGMKPGTLLLPAEAADEVEDMLRSWHRVERQQSPYELVPMRPGEVYEYRRDYLIRAHRAQHGPPSLGYAVVEVRHKLKPEHHDKSGEELRKLKEAGEEIQYRLEVPLVAYTGDTGPGDLFEQDDFKNAQILLTECTFFDRDHRKASRAGRHMHVEEFAKIWRRLSNEHVVILHVSRRTGVPRARRLLEKAVGEEGMSRVHFLMDLKGAKPAGDAAEAAGTVREA